MRKITVFTLLFIFCLSFSIGYSFGQEKIVKKLTSEDILSESICSAYLGYPASNLKAFDDELFVFIPKIGILFIDTSQHYLNIRSIFKIPNPYFSDESVYLSADQDFLYLYKSCYTCSDESKLMIIDKSNLENPQIVKTITLDQEIQKIEGDDNYFYVLTEHSEWGAGLLKIIRQILQFML